MVRGTVLLCLFSVAFAHPYVSSGYYDAWSATGDQLETKGSRPYMQSPAEDDERSPRQVRAVEYPLELENSPDMPQVAFVELDENALRTARSLISDQSINSNAQYESDSDNQILRSSARFGAQIPEVSSVYFSSPRENEHSSQNYKSFPYDNLPYVSSMSNPVTNSPSSLVNEPVTDFKQSAGGLNDYVKELFESNSKPTTDSKPPRMFGFYYMNIQRYPVKQQVFDDSIAEHKPAHQNAVSEALNRGQVNEDEILQLLQRILQQQITKFVQHQQQEHSLYQEFAQPPQTIKQTTQQESSTKKLDFLGNEEKKFIIERLHQEERWLQDSLKHVRDFLNELQTESVSSTSTMATSEVTSTVSNANKVIDRTSTTTESSSYLSTEPTTVPTLESISAAFNVASSDSSNKEQA